MGALGIDVKTQIWSVFTDMDVKITIGRRSPPWLSNRARCIVEIVRSGLGRQPSCALRP